MVFFFGKNIKSSLAGIFGGDILLITAYRSASGAWVMAWGSLAASSGRVVSHKRAGREWISSPQRQQILSFGGALVCERYSRKTLHPGILLLSAHIMGGIPPMLCIISKPLFPVSWRLFHRSGDATAYSTGKPWQSSATLFAASESVP